jgi:hypothetical protein
LLSSIVSTRFGAAYQATQHQAARNGRNRLHF